MEIPCDENLRKPDKIQLRGSGDFSTNESFDGKRALDEKQQ
jgi:hypothetical protein